MFQLCVGMHFFTYSKYRIGLLWVWSVLAEYMISHLFILSKILNWIILIRLSNKNIISILNILFHYYYYCFSNILVQLIIKLVLSFTKIIDIFINLLFISKIFYSFQLVNFYKFNVRKNKINSCYLVFETTVYSTF